MTDLKKDWPRLLLRAAECALRCIFSPATAASIGAAALAMLVGHGQVDGHVGRLGALIELWVEAIDHLDAVPYGAYLVDAVAQHVIGFFHGVPPMVR